MKAFLNGSPMSISCYCGLQNWGLGCCDATRLVWRPQSCVTAAHCSCARVVRWKDKVASNLTDVRQQLFELLACLQQSVEFETCWCGREAWLRRWLRRPNSEAQIRLHCGHLGLVVGGLGGLCLRVRRSSAAWSTDTLYIAKPLAQALFHVSRSVESCSRNTKKY